ncbi:hypothetical protein IKQ21_01350, partial [bacterium]|nr:hypothetical protein [bacterium]
MPFAKFPNLYPWAMDIVNWIFCFSALVILWKNAPFNNFTKICITFSVPFLQIYAVYPRCYSIGILFLFIAMCMYKNRAEHPYKYVTVLTLAANTNVLALFAAAILGIMFVFENIHSHKFVSKDDKKFSLFLLTVVILNLVLFFFQFHNTSLPDYEIHTLIKARENIRAYFGQTDELNLFEYLKIVLLWVGTALFPIMFWKNKQAFTFFVSSEIISLLFFTFVYGARYYHTCFLFIFAIMAFWMLKSDENFSERFMWKTVVFAILCVNMLFVRVHHLPAYMNTAVGPIIESPELIEGELYSNYTPIELSVVLPYLAKRGQTIHDMLGRDLNSYKALMLYFTKEAKTMAPDSFAEILDKDKRNFIILDGIFKDDYIKGKKYKFDVVLFKSHQEDKNTVKFNIYEVKNIQKIN